MTYELVPRPEKTTSRSLYADLWLAVMGTLDTGQAVVVGELSGTEKAFHAMMFRASRANLRCRSRGVNGIRHLWLEKKS